MLISKKELEKRISDSYEVPNNVIKAVPKPMVTVRTSTYQHGKYIKQCIEGVLSQKTNFPFEFIIGEDFSTDGTREIVLEYAKKYPDIIRVITADYNVGVKANGFRCIRAIRGKYIALCEGDDFWTDPNKLQKQVDFLENNKDYILSFHPVKVLFENSEEKDYIFPRSSDKSKFNLEELLKENYIQTNSVVYRNQNNSEVNFPIDIAPGDWFSHLYYAQFGKIGFINEVMAVYRRHSGGIWWSSYKDKEKFWKMYGIPHFNMFSAVLKIYENNPDYRKIIYQSMFRFVDDIIVTSGHKGRLEIIELISKKFPHIFSEYIVCKYEELVNAQKKVDSLESTLHTLRQEHKVMSEELFSAKVALAAIRSSRVWRARNKVVKLIGKQEL